LNRSFLRPLALALAAACACGAAAEGSGWLRKGSSLLYRDAGGEIAAEIGLGRWEDSGESVVTEGGVLAQGRFAWTLSRRVLRFFGSNGHELWSEDGADAPPGGEPLVCSASGEVCLLALRRSAWFVALKTSLGNTLWEAGPFPRLESLQISANGRYGLALWNEPDRSSAHSFLDLAARARRDVPSARFLLGKTAIDDQGRAFSGEQLAFEFSASTGTAPSVSTAAAAGARP